jgi:hypothetical protein
MAYKKKAKQNDDDRFKDWMEELKELQQSDLDQREQARDADRFLLDKDGQWEDDIARQLDSANRPRYTFDKVTPIIESIMADIEDMDFGCNVKPEGGEASKEVAKTLEGMIRSIQNMSSSENLFRKSARRIIRRGFDAWLVKADYKDDWSFDQDLFIKAIPNAINRVWVSNTCTNEDSSDADVAYVLTSLSPEAYEKEFPDGTGLSVDDADLDEHWDDYSPEVITIAERYYPIEGETEVAQLTNGDVVELGDKWDKIKDEQKALGITVLRTKKVRNFKWYHCTFDGGGILTAEQVTVFKSCPVVTVYGNHEILGQNSKITYSGIVLKEMDAQRVHNYAKSREIEEGALAPRAKLMMTKAQAKGHTKQIARMNISADPVQFYNPDPLSTAPPYMAGGPQINPHLTTLSNQMAVDIKEQAGVFDAMQGQFAGRQSEDSIRMQIDRGTASTRKWVNGLTNGIQRVCELLVQAIPDTYDTPRQMSIVGMDGTEEMVTLNEEVYDQQSQKMVKVNNLNAGKYRVTCSAGPAFSNRMEAGLSALMKYADVDPSIVQTAGDVMMKAIDAPLVDQIADRKRAQLIQAGMIPVEQMTDDEKAQADTDSKKPKEPDAMMIAAQAEMVKAEADMLNAENDKTRLMIDGAKLEQGGQKLSIEEAKAIADMRNKNANTAERIANAEKISGETIGTQLDNIGKLSLGVQ